MNNRVPKMFCRNDELTMRMWRRLSAFVLMLLALLVFAMPKAYAERLPEFLAKVQPAEIFPGADNFSKPEGKPMVVRAFKGKEQLGYVYLNTDVANARGYSSFPINMLVGISNDGTIVGAKLMEHHEPIVLIGIPQSKVDKFIGHYIGLNFLKNPPKEGVAPADMISGATVTLTVINDSLQRTAVAISRHYKLGTAAATAPTATASGAAVAATEVKTRLRYKVSDKKQDIQSWKALLDQKAIGHLHMTVADVNKAFQANGGPGAAAHPETGPDDDTFIDLYTAVVSQPSIGRSLLGESEYNNMKAHLKPGQQAIIIAGEGRYSWKGLGYVRGGLFDREEVVQGDTSFRFTDQNHERLLSLAAEGAPKFKEVSLFTIPDNVQFDAAELWRLKLMIQRVLDVKTKAFVTADLNYELPAAYREDDPKAPKVEIEQVVPQAAAVGATAAGAAAPAMNNGDAAAPVDTGSNGLWKQIWMGKKWQIAVVSVALTILILVFFFQTTLTSHAVFYDRFRLVFLTFSLFYIGWYTQAQLSVVNVLTFTSSLRTGFSWDYFLMDPLVFILWCATAISSLFWNRGAFCGWLCPFGSLQELLNRIAKKLGVKQITVPHSVHTRLAALKYVIFMVLFGLSLYDMGVAERFSEVEPFKTAIILKFVRDWWFVAFAGSLLVAGLFIERFYCRYLCPLGAALAIPARLRIFDWLRRYQMCGNPCQRCANDCPVQAIHPEGDIDPNECIQCLNCQMLYNHHTLCPQLVQQDRKKQKQAAAKAELQAQQAEAGNQQEQVVHFVESRPSEK